jgi:hypothetical protein
MVPRHEVNRPAEVTSWDWPYDLILPHIGGFSGPGFSGFTSYLIYRDTIDNHFAIASACADLISAGTVLSPWLALCADMDRVQILLFSNDKDQIVMRMMIDAEIIVVEPKKPYASNTRHAR